MASPEAVEPISYLWAIFMGALQGFTEFLPISSSGHLALAATLGRNQPENLAFDLFLHLATVLAVLAAFFRDIIEYVRHKRIVIIYLVIATIPAGIVGLTLKSRIELLREYPVGICAALLLTGILLAISDRVREGERPVERLGYFGAFLTGCFQAVGIIPGISRSGSTITGGLLCAMKRVDAVKFSFLMMVPAVVGANILEIPEILAQDTPIPAGPYLAGFFAALLSGYIAVKWMLNLVKARRLIWFALYCWVAGIAGIVYFLFFHNA